MVKKSYIVKFLKFILKIIKFLFVDLWSKVTWTEIIILVILGRAFLLFIAIYHANYEVGCSDGTREEIHLNSTYLCGRYVEVERNINILGVTWEINYLDYSSNSRQNDFDDYLTSRINASLHNLTIH